MPTLNWVVENQAMVTRILTQLSSKKQFASRRKKVIEKGGGSYMYIQVYYGPISVLST